MRFEPRLDPPGQRRSLASRCGWLVMYWLGGVAVVGTIAWLLRLVLSS